MRTSQKEKAATKPRRLSPEEKKENRIERMKEAAWLRLERKPKEEQQRIIAKLKKELGEYVL